MIPDASGIIWFNDSMVTGRAVHMEDTKGQVDLMADPTNIES